MKQTKDIEDLLELINLQQKMINSLHTQVRLVQWFYTALAIVNLIIVFNK